MPSTAASRVRQLALALLLTAACVMTVSWIQATGPSSPEAVGASSSSGSWKTVEYEGVRVDIPSAWERVDTSGCEFQFVRWAHPETPPCDFEEGVALYASATFDPAHRPGIRRTTENGIPGWGGYTYAGDFAVYISHDDRDVVRKVLASAQEPG